MTSHRVAATSTAAATSVTALDNGIGASTIKGDRRFISRSAYSTFSRQTGRFFAPQTRRTSSEDGLSASHSWALDDKPTTDGEEEDTVSRRTSEAEEEDEEDEEEETGKVKQQRQRQQQATGEEKSRATDDVTQTNVSFLADSAASLDPATDTATDMTDTATTTTTNTTTSSSTPSTTHADNTLLSSSFSARLLHSSSTTRSTSSVPRTAIPATDTMRPSIVLDPPMDNPSPPSRRETCSAPPSIPPSTLPSSQPHSSLALSASALPIPAHIQFGDYVFPEDPTLRDLRQLIVLDKSSKQKDLHQSQQLHVHLAGLALSARVSRGLDLAYDHAHDAFKNRQRADRREEFISAFNYSFEETEKILQHALAYPHLRASFLDMMSHSSSSAVLTFLHRLRTDHSILATAFKNMQSQELDTLLLPERPSSAAHSQFQIGRAGRDRGLSSHAGSTAQQQSTHSQSSQQRTLPSHGTIPNFMNGQDIVHIILNNLFGSSSFAGEHLLRTRTLRSIFVNLLNERKGERLMAEMLERYVIQSDWQHVGLVKSKFEHTLLDIIRKGDVVLAGFSDEELNAFMPPHTFQLHHHLQHHQHHQSLGRIPNITTTRLDVPESTTSQQRFQGMSSSFKEGYGQQGSFDTRGRIQLEPNSRQTIVENFYTEACLDVLNVLEEFCPPCLMELSRLIFAELDAKTRSYASLIIVVKFFYYRFMNKCIAYPETYGMMQDVYISEAQRQRILFATYHRLYRYVTGIMNPVPGWESRTSVIDARIRKKVEHLLDLFSSTPTTPGSSNSSQYTLSAVSASSGPISGLPRGTSAKTVVSPVLLLCPSDFTTLFYFVCPHLRKATPPTSGASSVPMARSSSFNGKGAVVTRQRTSSETPPTYPAAMKAAASTPASSSSSANQEPKPSPASAVSHASSTRTHKRSSPSFSFFSGAASSLNLKAKPPPPVPQEKPAMFTSDSSSSGTNFLALTGIKPGQVVSPKTANVEVTSSFGIATASGPPCLLPKMATPSQMPSSSLFQTGTTSTSSLPSHPLAAKPEAVIEHWSDDVLLPELKQAVKEIKTFQHGPIKEAPWALQSVHTMPLREPWALVYVQYGPKKSTSSPRDSGTEDMDPANNLLESQPVLGEAGITLAPPCMAMVMESAGIGETAKIVAVTKPILMDQVMDFAGGRDSQDNESHMAINLEVDTSDSESILSPEDNELAQRARSVLLDDGGLSILRINSSQMLSSMNDSGVTNINHLDDQGDPMANKIPGFFGHVQTAAAKWTVADRTWKCRIRQTVHSESDMPEEVQTVARSIFKILREFDLLPNESYGYSSFWDPTGNQPRKATGHESIRSLLLQGMEKAQCCGNHAAAIGIHHSLRVLDTSLVLRQLDSSKLIYLLAMPLRHRLEHRAGRASGRAIWESFAHSWHTRVVSTVDRKRESLSTLRIKMYYQTCVRASRTFEKSQAIVGVLSRLNKDVMRKYQSVDQYYGDTGYDEADSQGSESGDTLKAGRLSCDSSSCKGSGTDYPQTSHSGSMDIPSELHSRRHAALMNSSKGRRSSFSTYMENINSRSSGSLLIESTLGNLKEKEQVAISSSYNPHSHGSFWTSVGTSAASTTQSTDSADVAHDFTMDSKEIESVQRWVNESNIQNLLLGEDNFLRFCMEVESIVQGVGLGGTGIQGAGASQAQNGVMLPGLSSSGCDFFTKEVAKLNGQFVAGMGPSDAGSQAKPSSGSGVAEFLANSFKNASATTAATASIGGHLFTPASTATNNSNSSFSSSASSSSTSTYSTLGLGSHGKSRGAHQHTPNGSQRDLRDSLSSERYQSVSSSSGAAYALYRPQYATTSHNTSSMYGAPYNSGGLSTTPSHTACSPRDMPEFLRRIQIKLTSLVLSEWLDLFGEVETDRWFLEFLEEMSDKPTVPACDPDMNDQEDVRSTDDVNEDADMLPLNEMDLGDKANADRRRGVFSKGYSNDRTAIADPQDSDMERLDHIGRLDTIISPVLSTSPTESGNSAHEFGLAPTETKFSRDAFASLNNKPVKSKASGKSLLNVQVKNLNPRKSAPSESGADISCDPYYLPDAYRETIEQFNQAKSPYQKLSHLFALELLIVASLSYPESCTMWAPKRPLESGSQSQSSDATSDAGARDTDPLSPMAITPGTDMIVNEIEKLFRQPDILRPRHLLRDMQLIAALVPGTILNLRNDGKAFWDMSVAIMSLKTEVIQFVVRKGTKLVEVDECSNTKRETDKTGSRTIMHDDDERTRMTEAVRLFTIGAKESHPVAQRELAILYMSLPTLPMTSSPRIGQQRHEGSSPPLGQPGRMPSPIQITTSKFGSSQRGLSTGRAITPPPSSPKGTLSSSFAACKSNITASIPIKQRSRHHHQSSSGGSGSSFGSGVLTGLGIITGLGSFTGGSSLGSATGSNGSDTLASGLHKTKNSSTLSLPATVSTTGGTATPSGSSDFAEGQSHDSEQNQDLETQSDRMASIGLQSCGCNGSQTHSRINHGYHLHHGHNHHQHPAHLTHTHHGHHHPPHPHQHTRQQAQHEAGPEKFNPENVAAAMHWFKLAAAQGDSFSINYLKHKETAGGLLGNLG
ncbi:hypothetical protein BGW38_002681 [Lunasporangiospora selenospora]|uniref:Uncharacterized protein n=1 Tax=Lunasporangiospora selenospora TaxID=979761 RepID=A0A9P6KHT2_9FUNG|nr:hypothetical protein BGW38_002681 [Lunasporangiospora selenospora]